MTNLTTYQPDDGSNDLSSDLVQQQQLLIQLMQMSQSNHQKLARRQDAQAETIEELKEVLADTQLELKKQQNVYSLITINMLDTMLQAGWSEKDKIAMGSKLGAFSRKCNVTPTKVPHPTLPNGVNGYQPSIVKAWLEENGYTIPSELRYVD